MIMKRAIILSSGGIDSTTCIAYAKNQGYTCLSLSFDYGQRHRSELDAAKKVAAYFNVEHHIFKIDIDQYRGSALTDTNIDVPTAASYSKTDIPMTYVPARNTIFLSIALGFAEVYKIGHIFIGANAIDYSNYPDCRPEYIQAFQAMANLATKAAIQGEKVVIETPIIDLTKAQIIELGMKNGVDYSMTVSCYQADELGRACHDCHSCAIRKKGFEEAGVSDPTHYVK